MRSEASDSEPALAQLGTLRTRLLRWYRKNRRALPWRDDHDPYRIWVSEIMLQQTRVDVVVPYFERFIARFPNVQSLARARTESVLRAWSGLGYYRRARNLHAAARQVVREHGGEIPRDLATLRTLPGIGAYTAGAICSIAYGKPAAILDGNVVRVLTRWFGIDADVESSAVRRRLWDIAARWAQSRQPGDANQALMELGATLCTRPAPRCEACPVRASCTAHATHRTHELPRPRKRPEADTVHLVAFLIRRRKQLLVVRRDSGTLLQDWWEVPTLQTTAPLGSGKNATRRLETLGQHLGARLGVRVSSVAHRTRTRHGILAHRIEVDVVAAQDDAAPRGATTRRARSISPPADDAGPATPTALANLDLPVFEVRWVEPRACRRLPLTTLARKSLQAVAQLDSTWSDYTDENVGQ